MEEIRSKYAQSPEKSANRKIKSIVLVLSLAIHFLFFFVKFAPNLIKARSQLSQRKIYKIKFNDVLPSSSVAEKVKTGPSSSRARPLKQQIVNNENKDEKKRPDNSRFLGEFNQTHERQTIAKNIDIFNKAGVGSTDGVKGQKEQDKAKGKSNQANSDASISEKTKKLSLAALGLAPGNLKESLFENKIVKDQKGGGKGKAQGIKNGDHSSSGMASNNDFIEDVALGDFTHLNTVEFKYYGFYHRIRQKLEQFWGQSIREKAANMYRSGRRLPASDNLITSVAITLDDRGNILKVKILGTSGVKDLDDAAVESFNKAGPFPNPPRGMMVNGQTTIEWGFVVKS